MATGAVHFLAPSEDGTKGLPHSVQENELPPTAEYGLRGTARQTMKKSLSRVILSAAKNLKPSPGRADSLEILRCAQNDMFGRFFYGVLYYPHRRAICTLPMRYTSVYLGNMGIPDRTWEKMGTVENVVKG